MYNVDKADRLLKRKLEKDPSYTKKLIEKIKEQNPEEFAKTISLSSGNVCFFILFSWLARLLDF